jgi:hypothetical protein
MSAPYEPSSDFKPNIEALEDGQNSDANIGTAEIGQFDQVNTARLLRKIDWHLVPLLALLYLYAFQI